MQPPQARWWLALLPPLVLVVLVIHVAILVGGRTWAEPARVTERTPAQLAVVEALAAGHAPAWWDRAGLGTPLWAEPAHGAAYPGWWPAAADPDHAPWSLDALAVLHVLWAALGAALLARRLGADDTGALAAGALLGASDLMTAQAVSGALAATAHLPWIALAADALARAPDRQARAGAAAGVAAALGAMVLAGRWLIAADAALIATVLIVVRAPGARRGVALAWAGVATLVGLAVGAALLVPALAHLAGDLASTDAAHASPWATLEMILPGAQQLGGAPGPGTYVGGLVLVLAVVAIVGGDRPRRALAALAALLAVAAGGVLAPWDQLVSAHGAAGHPAEHAAASAALLAALAGVGLTRLGELPPLRAGGDAVVTLERRALIALAGAGAALVIAVAAIAAARPALARALEGGVGDLDLAVARVDHVLAHGGAAVALTLLAVAYVVLGRARGWARPADVAIVLAVAHAAVIGRLERPLTDRAALAERPSMLAAAERVAAESSSVAERGGAALAVGAVLALRDAGLAPRIYRPAHVAAPELVDRVQTFDGAAAARVGLGAARWAAPGRQRGLELLWRAAAAVGARMFDRYGIELALLPSSVAIPAALAVLGERSGVVLVATGARRPRASVAPRWRWFADDAAIRAAIFAPPGVEPLPLGVVARLGDGAAPADTAGAGLVPCAARADRPERVVLHCDGPAGVAVLLEAWAPGWSVTVDGEPARLERVDGAVRGVAVTAGAHAIVFVYAAPGGALGRYLTAVGLLGLLGLFAASRRSRVAP